MAGKKNFAMIMVVDGLTNAQQAELNASITKAKNRIAPNARGTIANTTSEHIGKKLQAGWKKLGHKEDH